MEATTFSGRIQSRHGRSAPARLVGRHSELALIADRWRELDESGARAVALVGELGIGKTALLAHAIAEANREFDLVLISDATEFDPRTPYGPFVGALDSHVRTLPAERISAERVGALEAIFPSLGDGPHHPPDGHRCRSALRALLEDIGDRRRKVLLVLDDIDRADEASLELLADLLRRPVSAPILLLAAGRHERLLPAFADTLASVSRAGLADVLTLEPLSAEEIAELAPSCDEATCRELHHESGGVPLFAEQLLTSGDPRPSGLGADQPSVEDLAVPVGIRRVVAVELALLSPSARLLAQGAAVSEDPFELDAAASIATVDDDEARSAIDELLAVGIVRGTETPGRFRFRIPIVRRAIYASTGEGWRLGAHQRAVVTMRERGCGPLAVARHVERSARAGDAADIDALTAAGDNAEPSAPLTAARWYNAALRLLPAADRGERRFRLLLASAVTLTGGGQFNDAEQTLGQALELIPTGPSAYRARALRLAARLHWIRNRTDLCRTALTAALDAAVGEASGERPAVVLELADDAWRGQECERATELATAALTAGREQSDHCVCAGAAALLAQAHCLRGDGVAAARWLDEATAAIGTQTEVTPGGALRTLALIAEAAVCADRLDDADRYSTQALDLGRASGRVDALAPLLAQRSRIRLLGGEVAAALDDASAAVDLAQRLDVDMWRLMSFEARAGALLAGGDTAGALADARAAVEASAVLPHEAWAAAAALVRTQLAAGRPEITVIEGLIRAAGGSELTRVRPDLRPECARLLAECELGADRLLDAERWLTVAAAAAAQSDRVCVRAEVDAGRAALKLVEGSPSEAAGFALLAAFSFDNAGRPIASALSRTLAGRALGAAGDRPAAITELETALRELAGSGAQLAIDEASRELRRLGRRVGSTGKREPRASAGVGALSGRERQVALLVAEGHTNKEIAARLFLSGRTVESHLARIFDKLGASSRAAVASVVARSEIRVGPGEDPPR